MINYTRGQEDVIVHMFTIHNSCVVEFRQATILRLPFGFLYDLLGRLEGTYAKSAVHLIGRDPEMGFCSILTE